MNFTHNKITAYVAAGSSSTHIAIMINGVNRKQVLTCFDSNVRTSMGSGSLLFRKKREEDKRKYMDLIINKINKLFIVDDIVIVNRIVLGCYVEYKSEIINNDKLDKRLINLFDYVGNFSYGSQQGINQFIAENQPH